MHYHCVRTMKNAGPQERRRCFIFGVEEIYEKYSGELYGYLFSLTRSRADAEDLLSEVFIRILTGLHSFRGESSLRTWLYAVARNVWLEQLRKKRRAVNREELLSVYAEDSACGEALANLAAGRILELVNRMDEPARSVVLLRSEGFHYEEIAERLHIKASSARVVEHRARRRLRELLEKEGMIDE